MAKYGPKMAQMAKMLVPGPCGPHSGHFLKFFLLKMDFSWSYTYTVIIAKHLDDYFYVLRAISLSLILNKKIFLNNLFVVTGKLFCEKKLLFFGHPLQELNNKFSSDLKLFFIDADFHYWWVR